MATALTLPSGLLPVARTTTKTSRTPTSFRPSATSNCEEL